MKRSVDESASVGSSAKRLLLQAKNALVDCFWPTVELRVGLLPPLPNQPVDDEQHQVHRSEHAERRTAIRTRTPFQSLYLSTLSQPHLALPSESTGPLYDLIGQLPQARLMLSRFSVISAVEGRALCQSESFASQQAADEALSALPLGSRLTVKGLASSFQSGHNLLDAVCVSFGVTLREADTASGLLQASGTASAGAFVIVPILLAALDNDSVQLHTSFRLLPHFSVPLRSHLRRSNERTDDAVGRMCSAQIDKGDAFVAFEMAADDEQPLDRSPILLSDLLRNHHRPRADGSGDTDKPLLAAFASLSPSVQLSSLVVAYVPGDSSPLRFEVEVQSPAVLQWRGFHVDQPCLRLTCRAIGALTPAIRGLAHATYSTAGSGAVMESKADISIDTTRCTVRGDCLSMLRWTDILRVNALTDGSSATRDESLHPSHTTLSHSLESTLANQLPWLVPSTAPSLPPGVTDKQAEWFGERWNRVTCSYNLINRAVLNVKCHDITLRLVDSSDLAASTPSVLLSSAGHVAGDTRLTQYQLSPFLNFAYQPDGRRPADSISTTSLMPLAQLLTCIGMPTTLVPAALLQRVLCSDVSITLVVEAASGVAVCLVGRAGCGASRHDELLFYNRLATAASVDGACNEQRSDHSRATDDGGSRRAPQVDRWLRLQCRAVLDPVVFPQLASLAADRCLEPLWQYVLCETARGVALTSEQTKAFLSAYPQFTLHQQHWDMQQLNLRPTNAVFALQPHLPSGYLELPLTALAATTQTHLSSTAVTIFPSPTSAAHSLAPATSSSSALSTSPLCLLVEVGAVNVELLRLCTDYLDTNSILFGLLPALHSLPTISAALSTEAYGRRVLLNRYGAWCDCELWSEALLRQWRSQGFGEQRQQLNQRYGWWPKGADIVARLGAEVDRADAAAHSRDVWWAAVVDLQRRINRFLICIMRQRKEHILPQLYERPPGTVRPIFCSPPNAALALLLCAPPFQPLPVSLSSHTLHTSEVCARDDQTLANTSPHHADFADFMTSDDCYWSLYMGPVYVYEDQLIASRGVAVRLDDVLADPDADGRSVVDQQVEGRALQPDRGVRLLYIDDVNQLPVTRCMPFVSDDHVSLHAPTLSAFFKAAGVRAWIEKRRERWRLAAVKHAKLHSGTAEHESEAGEGGEAEETEREEEKEEDEGEDELDDFDQPEPVMDDRDGAAYEYVLPLMRALFEKLHQAMWKEQTWTGGAAELAATASGSCV